MNFPAFNYNTVFSNQNDCDDGKYFYYNTFQENGTEFVRLFTSFPPNGSIPQDKYKIWFIFALDNGVIYRVTDKVTVFRQQYRLGELISIMSTLLSNNCEPSYSYTKNDLLTERRITVGRVCVYRDYVWNVANRLSYTSKDNYERLEKEVTNKIQQSTADFSLFYDLSAIQCGYHLSSRMIPDSEFLPQGMRSVVDVSQWNDISRISPFWPEIREHLIDKLSERGWIDFYPMDDLRVEKLANNRPIDRKFQDLISNAKKRCCKCYQDYCVWDVNGDKILENIELVTGGVWYDFLPNKRRREFGCIQANFAIRRHGRDSGRTKTPSCVVVSLQPIFPDE